MLFKNASVKPKTNSQSAVSYLYSIVPLWCDEAVMMRLTTFGWVSLVTFCLTIAIFTVTSSARELDLNRTIEHPLVAQDAPTTVSKINLMEATISSIHEGIKSGELNCTQVVDYYLKRINTFDSVVNAVLTINANAAETAAQIDKQYAKSGLVGPLHCIPVVAKDNYDTADMPTTGGSVVLAKSTPSNDAFTIQKLRAAGAIILAKANMSEFAQGGITSSSLGGQTRNPYDLNRTPGGSSGGSGVAVAMNFAVLGTASDTGQSTRSPASANNLVGIRSTQGLVSRDGIIPVSFTQDNAGQLARTVTDAAIMLDVMAGYDRADPLSAFGFERKPSSYTEELDIKGLQGARIGVFRDVFGKEEIHAEVNAVTEAAIKKMTQLGAKMTPVTIPNFSKLIADIGVDDFEFKATLNTYLQSLGASAPVKSLAELIARKKYDPIIEKDLLRAQSINDFQSNPDYRDRLLRRAGVRQALMKVMADNDLDAIFYPHQKRLVVPIGETVQAERNGVLSNSTGFPAVSFPGGFSRPTQSAPIGVPVGIELLGPEWSEAKLLKFAYAFEQATKYRRSPQLEARI